MRKLLLTAVIAVVSSLSALAAQTPWAGTWVLDLNKSKFTGSTITYTKLANGMYEFSDGSAITFQFGTDGKEYPIAFGRSQTWTATADNAWTTLTKMNGAVISAGKAAVDYDGKTLTISDSGSKPDGSTFRTVNVYTRVSGKMGLEGKWKATQVNISAPDNFVISAPSEGVLHWEMAEYKEIAEGKADGSDIPVTGPTAPAGMTLAITMQTTRKLSYTVKLNGKPIELGEQILAGDGKTLTDTSWSPGKESEKKIEVYARQ
jgi:hypothetical protein